MAKATSPKIATYEKIQSILKNQLKTTQYEKLTKIIKKKNLDK